MGKPTPEEIALLIREAVSGKEWRNRFGAGNHFEDMTVIMCKLADVPVRRVYSTYSEDIQAIAKLGGMTEARWTSLDYCETAQYILDRYVELYPGG